MLLDGSTRKQSLAYRTVTNVIRFLTTVICRIDDEEINKVPRRGPLLLVTNHIQILDIPIIYTRMNTQWLTAFIKVESWSIPIQRGLVKLWEGIPLHRGEADMAAFRKARAMLDAGYIVAVAPEGTRSHHGRLQQGLPGVALLGVHSGVPILPLAYHGLEHFWHNFARFRKTPFHVRVGKPFYLNSRGERVNRALRRKMIDEVMYQLAELLPPQNRGVYADLSKATQHYLDFVDIDPKNYPVNST